MFENGATNGENDVIGGVVGAPNPGPFRPKVGVPKKGLKRLGVPLIQLLIPGRGRLGPQGRGRGLVGRGLTGFDPDPGGGPYPGVYPGTTNVLPSQ